MRNYSLIILTMIVHNKNKPQIILFCKYENIHYLCNILKYKFNYGTDKVRSEMLYH